ADHRAGGDRDLVRSQLHREGFRDGTGLRWLILWCLQQPAGLARPARSFLLLAQKKGPKEEGLNTIRLLPLATEFGC
ncbi:MAG TPA: hypothetical protein PK756_15760, partial [Piscinibacter sp.]|nr:hypothetical protein [Piscinibacter sp.]